MCRTFRNEQGLGKEKTRPQSAIVMLENRNFVVHRYSVVAGQTHRTGDAKQKAKDRKNRFLLQARFSMHVAQNCGLSRELAASWRL